MTALPDLILREIALCESSLEVRSGQPYSASLRRKRDALSVVLATLETESDSLDVSPAWKGQRLAEIGFLLETKAGLPRTSNRKPSLDQYERRRTQSTDRYRFGIYPID